MNTSEMETVQKQYIKEIMKLHNGKQNFMTSELNEQLKKLQQTLIVKMSLLEFVADEMGLDSSMDGLLDSLEYTVERISVYRRAISGIDFKL